MKIFENLITSCLTEKAELVLTYVSYRDEADIIINGDSDLTYFSQILEYFYTITNNFDA